jgi:hypothetical protein
LGKPQQNMIDFAVAFAIMKSEVNGIYQNAEVLS